MRYHKKLKNIDEEAEPKMEHGDKTVDLIADPEMAMRVAAA